MNKEENNKKDEDVEAFKDIDTSEKIEVDDEQIVFSNEREIESENRYQNDDIEHLEEIHYNKVEFKKEKYLLENDSNKVTNSIIKTLINASNIVMIVVLSLLISTMINFYLIDYFVVSGKSMDSTLNDGQRIVVYKYKYKPKRGDIVVIDANEIIQDKDVEYIVKRVIGVPGDFIFAENDNLYINGELYTETYLDEEKETYKLTHSTDFTPDFSLEDICSLTNFRKDFSTAELYNEFVNQFPENLPSNCEKIPDGYYLVLGDNRPVSLDSTELGLVKEENFHSKAIAIISPKSDFEWLFVVFRKSIFN